MVDIILFYGGDLFSGIDSFATFYFSINQTNEKKFRTDIEFASNLLIRCRPIATTTKKESHNHNKHYSCGGQTPVHRAIIHTKRAFCTECILSEN